MPDASQRPDRPGRSRNAATIEELFTDLDSLTTDDGDETTRDEIRDVETLLVEAHERGLIDSRIRDLRASDAAEALVGSVIFASPLLVEDGIYDIGAHLFESTYLGIPWFLVANTVFVVVMTYALIEWTGRDREETRVVFGVVPMRLLMVLTISFVVATVMMTVWGRLGNWQQPVEALARINVLWTVGSLGAALGDILAEDDRPRAVPREERSIGGVDAESASDRVRDSASDRAESMRNTSDGELMDALHAEFDDLESIVDESGDGAEVTGIRQRTFQAAIDDSFGDTVLKYTSRDIAEAFVGSVFFSIPLLVEDGVYDVASFFLSFRVGPFPVFFLINSAFVLFMILALVYWAGPIDVKVNRPVFGFVPRRMLGIAAVSFLTAALLMTMWGRVGGWEDPVVALARVSVVWTVASFGAALGDILPGESSGADINDELSTFAQRSGDRIDEGLNR